MDRRYIFFSVIVLMSFLLISCDDWLTGQTVGPEDPYVREHFMRCSDNTGLSMDDVCLSNDARVLKILVRNERQGRIESLFLDFMQGDESQRREIGMTMDIGSSRVLEQRVPDNMDDFDMVTLQPTYKAHDGTLLGCTSFDIGYDEIRECQDD